MSTQKFKSKMNVIIDQEKEKQKQLLVSQQFGEIPFSIDANCSIKLAITFTKEFATIPILTTSIITPDNFEFELTANITCKTTKNCVVNIQSTADQPCKAVLQYIGICN